MREEYSVKRRKPTIKELQSLNILALILGLLLIFSSANMRLVAWNNNQLIGLASTCFWGPISFLLISLFVIYILVLVILNIDFARQNRAGLTGKHLVLNWLPLVLALISVCSIPLITPLVDNYIQVRQSGIGESFVSRVAKEFDLQSVLPEYDKVIDALEDYHNSFGQYPANLSDLVPDYLPEVPGIYIRNGEKLTYNPEPMNAITPPYTFSIYGHYPGGAFMHGWTLDYCPVRFVGCTAGGDSYRINDRWLWQHHSAL